jgi:aryl-alcohol dehydrogenase-like predicted oxidoreductase
MEYHQLGHSDLRISRIGFGCMSLDPEDDISEKLLLRALEEGINYFDTADLYQHGRNEELLGRAFRGKRDKIILATKVGNQWRPDGSGWDWNPSKKYILSSVDQSLKRLQTDSIDLYQLHGGTFVDPIDDIIETFELLRTAGKIRYYGISSIRPNVIREYVKRSSIISVMMQYSLLDRRPEEEMLPLLSASQIGVLARGTIARGLLISKPAEQYLNYTAGQVEMLKSALKSIGGKSHSFLEMSLQYVLQHSPVTSAVIGIRTEKQLLEALHAAHSKNLSDYQIEVLQNILPANKYLEHR